MCVCTLSYTYRTMNMGICLLEHEDHHMYVIMVLTWCQCAIALVDQLTCCSLFRCLVWIASWDHRVLCHALCVINFVLADSHWWVWLFKASWRPSGSAVWEALAQAHNVACGWQWQGEITWNILAILHGYICPLAKTLSGRQSPSS